jgi:PKD repeat protein
VAGYVNATSGAVTGSAAVNVVVINSAPVVFPVANVTATMAVPKAFSGLAVDVDKDPLRYTWNFGDGSPLAVGQSLSHIFAKPGVWTYTLFVDDLTGIIGHNVSSSAVVTVPFVINLLTGWNLISIPVQGTLPYKASTLGLSTGDEVFGWSSATQTYPQMYIVGVTPSLFDFVLQPSQGYWIFVSSPKTISFVGNVPTAQQSLAFTIPAIGGSILVGLSSMSTTNTAATLASMITGATTTTISAWNAATQSFAFYIVGFPMTPFAIVPGQGYFAFVTASVTLTYTP